jgi:thiol-disulfide isomerase/thioredoxin
MLKKITLSMFALLFTATLLSAQTTKKYTLVEHFTNSKCGSCAGSNPALYASMDKFPDYVHHISYHPSIPYPACQFYQLNTKENDARATKYNISGTPSMYVNGKFFTKANFEAALLAEKNKKCPVRFDFAETTTASQIKLDYHAITTDAVADPFKVYRFYVAAVEKLNTAVTSNGEKTHRDVFYKFVGNTTTPENGVAFGPGNKGNDVFVKNIIFDVPAGKKGSDFYFIMWIQDPTTLEILTSGTKFDKTTGTEDIIVDTKFEVYPNPATNNINVDLSNIEATPERISVIDLIGNEIIVANTQKELKSLDVSSIPTGLYFVKVSTDKGILTKQFIKQ